MLGLTHIITLKRQTGDKMRAEDLRWSELIMRGYELGFPYYGPYRMMIIGFDSMIKLINDM